ncbi:MAG: hypothetical protein AB8G99_16375 [Planctomycetaceae bacterium]
MTEPRIADRKPIKSQCDPEHDGIMDDKTLGHTRTCDGGFLSLDRKAPRGGLYSNQGLVEVGAYHIRNLRRQGEVSCYPWDAISAIPTPSVKPRRPRYDPMRLALHYQSILDSGQVESRAQLARQLGVSRARVTQVLKRLQD